MTDVDLDLLQQYFAKTDDELYTEVGAELLREGRGIGPANDDRLRKFGQDWFTNQLGRLRRKICQDERIAGLIEGSESDRLADATALLVALLDTSDSQAIKYVLAVLIARRGLQQFCAVDDD